MNFKIGDKVRIKNNLEEIENFEGDFLDILNDYIGNICTIEKIIRGGRAVNVKENNWTWDIRALELANITINNLQFGDIVTLRNGERYVVADCYLHGESDMYNGDCYSIYDMYNKDLTQNENNEDEDIVKVQRDGKVIYDREDTKVREMTVAEISKALGYEVKVVK